MKRAILYFILLVTLMACTDDKKAKQVLKTTEWTQVSTTGFEPFLCNRAYFYSTGFIARNKNGTAIQGAVCSGSLFFGVARIIY